MTQKKRDIRYIATCFVYMYCIYRYDRSSLKVLGTVGEPINPEAWLWYYNVVGDKKCAIVDTFWQTETVSHRQVIVYVLLSIYCLSTLDFVCKVSNHRTEN
jgi:acyl-coenzyme A synthetase/AMP-(fatty) acid ligase